MLDQIELGIREAQERLEKASAGEHASAFEHALPSLAERIKSGTVTVQEIGSFLDSSPEISPELKEYLLRKKAWMLLRGGQGDQAIHQYDQALSINPSSPVTWALKGAAFLELNRIDQAFQAFQKAYALKEHFGPRGEGYLRDLFLGWSLASVFLGLSGIAEQDTDMATNGVEEYLSVKEKAEAENMPEAATLILQAGDQAEPGVAEGIEEWELMVKLMSIKDPFEGWRALGKEISKVWPKGLSAVEAVREMRQ